MMGATITALQIGLTDALLAMGVYITFRILNTPDLTADGSYVLGLVVSAVFTKSGHPWLGLLVALLAGALAGGVTGFLQTKAGIHPVLAGILTMFGLQSINLLILGAPNLNLPSGSTIFNIIKSILPQSQAMTNVIMITVPAVFVLISVLVLKWFFGTQMGLSIRATGNNPDMVRASSINVDLTKMVGFAVANAFVALSGALVTQAEGSADISRGIGTITIGMAALIIGEVICGRRSVFIGLISAVVGGIVYRLILQVALNFDFPQYMFKLLSAVIIGLALSIPAFQKNYKLNRIKHNANKANKGGIADVDNRKSK